MHVVYTHDNFHLAKILLLRLKGIKVTGDNNSRIVQVKDEDLNETFVAHGGLWMDEESERRCQEAQRRGRERRRQAARERRLKVCARIWEDNAEAWKVERAKVALRKEAVASVRRRVGIGTRERGDRDAGTRTARQRTGAFPNHTRAGESSQRWEHPPRPVLRQSPRPQPTRTPVHVTIATEAGL